MTDIEKLQQEEWETAPEWANWLAQDESGGGWWFWTTKRPEYFVGWDADWSVGGCFDWVRDSKLNKLPLQGTCGEDTIQRRPSRSTPEKPIPEGATHYDRQLHAFYRVFGRTVLLYCSDGWISSCREAYEVIGDEYVSEVVDDVESPKESIREILEEAFRKVSDQHGLILETVDFPSNGMVEFRAVAIK